MQVLLKIDDPAKRNQALFEWIKKHKKEYGRLWQVKGESSSGWGTLDWKPFQLILETCRPEDAWRALKLFHELDHRPGYGPYSHAFGSLYGRAILTRIAFDKKESPLNRKLALYQLGEVNNLWPRRLLMQENPGLSQIDAAEQQRILDEGILLLKDEDAEIRELSARFLNVLGNPSDSDLKDRHTKAGLDALLAAYKNESAIRTRQEMAKAVLDTGGEESWKQASGNPAGILMKLYCGHWPNLNNAEVIKIAYSEYKNSGRSFEPKRIIMEQLAPNQTILERKEFLLPLKFNEEFNEEFNKKDPPKPWMAPSIVLPCADMAEGTWRISMVGSSGDHQWRSEPELLELKREKK